jgi:dTDP-4-amino-4,6-dideoxygalactose transaminase
MKPGQSPLVDLPAHCRPLRSEMDRAILAAVESGQSIFGLDVSRFEKDIAAYLGVKHFVACRSGTSAVTL